jgi:hypothetical protein
MMTVQTTTLPEVLPRPMEATMKATMLKSRNALAISEMFDICVRELLFFFYFTFSFYILLLN